VALAWIKERTKLKGCVACGKNNFELGAHVVAPIRLSGTQVQFGGATYPSVPLICRNCGYTYFFNAVVMGIYEPAKDADDVGE
jgi:predicted nucleic-acid-binding Zn-ribbon protein